MGQTRSTWPALSTRAAATWASTSTGRIVYRLWLESRNAFRMFKEEAASCGIGTIAHEKLREAAGSGIPPGTRQRLDRRHSCPLTTASGEDDVYVELCELA